MPSLDRYANKEKCDLNYQSEKRNFKEIRGMRRTYYKDHKYKEN